MKNSAYKRLMISVMAFALYVSAAPIDAATPAVVRLADHVPTKAVKNATFFSHVDPETNIPLTFVLPLRNQKELQDLLNRMYDPNDKKHYGKYLTSKQFNERFAPTQADYDQVVAYAKGLGLTVRSTHPNRTLLNVHGSAKTVQSAFAVRLHHYTQKNGRKFYAPHRNPEVTSAIASVISGIVGLDNHAKRHTYHRKQRAQASGKAGSHAFPSGPNGGFSPSDLVMAYNLSGLTANGTNQNIALFELASYTLSDITAYTTYFGLPAPKLQNVMVDGGSGTGPDAEVTLDMELALALAPQSTIYVYEGPNSDQGSLDTYNRIATDNLAKQVSSSWGLGEDMISAQSRQAENAIFQQMAAQGQTVYVAAGDSGAYDDYPSNSQQNLVVDDPASQPYVTGVGGTTLFVNANTGAYQSESVWNDGLGNGAGGGGVSAVWPLPSWQASVPTVYSKTNRNVPDVCLNADTNTGYAIYFGGQWQIYGGTSCAAPLWAAFTACVNQELAATGQSPLGFANPKFYAIGNGAAYTTNFNDVTTGNNLFYNASVGYDNASGWGSFNGLNLLASLTCGPSTMPIVSMIMKHNAPFSKGGVGTYRIVVSNIGNAPASGPVVVSVSLPTGLTYGSFSGSGWTFDKGTLSFARDGSLTPGSSYPTIVLNVNVAGNAPYQVVPSASVSMGGTVLQTVTNLTTTH